MGYQYQNSCLETVDDLYQQFSLNCTGNVVSSGSAVGYVTQCTPAPNGVNVRFYSLSNGNAVGVETLIHPQQISCTSSSAGTALPIEDIVALSWLVAGVWVVAWGIRKIADALSTK